MKHAPLFAAVALALAMLGCAGSDGNAGSGVSPAVTVHIEAVSKLDPTEFFDPENFQVGEQYIFQLAGYDAAGKRSLIPVAVWKSSDTNNQFGTLGGNSGSYVAKNQQSPELVVQAEDLQGNVYRHPYAIKPRQCRLVGRVVDEVTPTRGVGGLVIDFYALTPVDPTDPDAPQSQVLVATGTTAVDGTFRASVPSSASSFQIRSESVPAAYHRSFLSNVPSEGGLVRFDSGQDSCLPPLPANLPSVGQANMAADILLTPKSVGGKPDAMFPCYNYVPK